MFPPILFWSLVSFSFTECPIWENVNFVYLDAHISPQTWKCFSYLSKLSTPPLILLLKFPVWSITVCFTPCQNPLHLSSQHMAIPLPKQFPMAWAHVHRHFLLYDWVSVKSGERPISFLLPLAPGHLFLLIFLIYTPSSTEYGFPGNVEFSVCMLSQPTKPPYTVIFNSACRYLQTPLLCLNTFRFYSLTVLYIYIYMHGYIERRIYVCNVRF